MILRGYGKYSANWKRPNLNTLLVVLGRIWIRGYRIVNTTNASKICCQRYVVNVNIYSSKSYIYFFVQIDQLQNKTKEERQLEKMIRKTGKEIHRLRKAKLGQNELDKHMFAEKLTFLTTSKAEVVPPILNLEESNLICNSRSSTLKHVDHPPSSAMQSVLVVSGSEEGCDIDSSSSSTCSTPTPHLNKKTSSDNPADANTDQRFSYEIDPDIGVIV